MAQTTSLVFNGGVIPSPSPAPSGSGKAKLLKIGEITVTEQEVQVTKNVICDPDSVTTVAPFMEVLTSARLAELISANNILVLDDGTMQYLMSDATISVEDGTSVCTAVNFLGLSKENRAKVLYPCTRLTDELTLQQVLEVGEPIETDFNLVKADPEDTESGTLIDKLEVVDNVRDPDDPDDPPLLHLEVTVDGQGNRKVAINEDALKTFSGNVIDSIETLTELINERPSDEHGYFNSSLYTTPGDGTTTNLVMGDFRISENRDVHGDSIEFVPTHQEGGVDFGEVWLEPGTYILATQFTLQWVGNPRGTFLPLVANVADQPFDFSYEHEDVIRTTRIITKTTRGKLVVNIAIDADTPPMGVWVKNLEVAKIASPTYPKVAHDTTLTGTGKVGDPLGVTTDAFGKVKNIPTSISQFRNGDVIPVDGPNGPAKMDKDDLLTETAQNAFNNLPGIVPISNIVRSKHITSDGEFTNSPGFSVFIYRVNKGAVINFKSVTGNGFCVFADENYSAVGNAMQVNPSFTEYSVFSNITVPSGAKYLFVTCRTAISANPCVVSCDSMKLSRLAYDRFLDQSVSASKIPASPESPITCYKKNLFTPDRIGLITIHSDRYLKYEPGYTGVLIPLDEGKDYVISGYGGNWRCIGIWSLDLSKKIACRCNDSATYDDILNLMSIPDGETWRTATQYNIHSTVKCMLVIGFSAASIIDHLQVEEGSTPTEYVPGPKLLPNYIRAGETTKPWKGKKLLVIGDSITERGLFPAALVRLSGCSIYNRGAGGTRITSTSTSTSSFCNRLDMPENNTSDKNHGFPSNDNVDAVIMFGGTNDWASSVPLGSLEDSVDTYTFYGALKYMAEGLKSRYQRKPIVFLSLMNAARSTEYTGHNRVTFAQDGSFTYRRNSQNALMSDYHDAQKNVCELYGIVFLDMFQCGFSPISAWDYENLTSPAGDPPTADGLHPNALGAEIIARYVYGKLKDIFLS